MNLPTKCEQALIDTNTQLGQQLTTCACIWEFGAVIDNTLLGETVKSHRDVNKLPMRFL